MSEAQTAAVATEGASAAPVPSKLEEYSNLSGESSSAFKRSYVQEHGEHGWGDFLAGKANGVANGAPVKNGADKAVTNGNQLNGKANGEHVKVAETSEGDELEPGEITINADGKPYDAKTGQFVPKAHLLRVKGEAKELKETNKKLLDNLVQDRERLADLLEKAVAPAKEPAKVEEDVEPNPEEDFLAHAKWQAREIKRLREEMKGAGQKTAEQFQAQAINDFTVSDARAFTSKQPDFAEALTHAMEAQIKIKKALGAKDEATARKETSAELQRLIASCHESKASWAERVYAYAKEVGYAKKDAAAEADPAKKAALEELERIKGAPQSLRNAGGSGSVQVTSLAKYGDMSGPDASSFRSSYIAKNGKEAWADFLGGRRSGSGQVI